MNGGDMNSRKFVAAICISAALVIPVSLAAQENQRRDADYRHHHGHDFKITILQTTDVHDHANGSGHVGLDVDPVNGTSVTGAYARIAAYVNDVRVSAGHPVILVDSGDWTMGTLYDLTLGTRPLALQFLEFMHYDCVTLGNHEFDYTPKGLAQLLGAAQSSFGFRIPIVASNMNLGGDTDLAPFVGRHGAIRSTRIEELADGIKVGYIGLMGKAAAQDAPGSAPVSFTDFSADYAVVQDLVDSLRNEGVQIVVVLSHSGTDATGTTGEDVELAKHVTGVDVIASGHTHTPLSSAHTVANGSWNTQIIDAGAYGANVARIDLTYHDRSKSTTLDASSNLPMTDASLAGVNRRLAPDRLLTRIVRSTDHQLNVQLGAFFSQAFPDYDATNLAKGIYHPVGATSQDMVSNGMSPVPPPNGLGDLAADSIRSVPNSIIAQTLAAAGGNPANLPGYDFTPFQASAVATGVLRSQLQAGVPLSFADVYNVLPLGISPDSSQALPVGYPLVSTYLDYADMQKVCALQLVAQTNLAPADYYLNLSGLQYGLKAAESYAYFKYATAAGVLQVTSQKASGGSTDALQALGALSTLGTDSGAALLALYGGGNPYATAMVQLNDTNPSGSQIAANLGALGQVAAAAAADSAAGTNTLSALVVSKAVAAIDTLSGFAPNDSANTGPATPLSGTARVRVAVDLYAILLLGAVEARFGTAITAYASATGPAVLSGADLAGLLANRIDAAPGSAGVQELKEWMALLSYVGTGLDESIPPAYASTSNFTQFGSFGAAVQTRNATYPIASIGQFAGTLASLQTAP
jgi:2',3'-cyclic-nucleotide 2'-phosphodiesterase (5'-nucleotidase family)